MKASGGWEGFYQRKDRFTYFEEAGEINGYPAAHWDITGYGTDGVCSTTVGARHDLTFTATVHVNVFKSPEYRDACLVSDKVAGMVIDTVRAAR